MKRLLQLLSSSIFITGFLLVSTSIMAQTTVYQEDFASDPGYTIPYYTPVSGEYFQWNSIDETYEVRIKEKHGGILKWAYSPAFELIGEESFEISVDLKLIETSFGMPIGIAFCKDGDQPESKMWIRVSSSNDRTIQIADGTGNLHESPDWVDFDKWYTVKVIYYSETGTVDINVTETSGGNVFWQMTGGTFNPNEFDLCTLGFTTRNNDGSWAEMEFDNIKIIKGLLAIKDDYVFISELNIFPNPTSKFFNINYSGSNAIREISIYNINGQNIITHSFHSYIKTYNIDVSQLTPGIYIAIITFNNKVINKNIVIK